MASSSLKRTQAVTFFSYLSSFFLFAFSFLPSSAYFPTLPSSIKIDVLLSSFSEGKRPWI
jgi:hypothetical protein